MGFTAQELAENPLPLVNDESEKVPTIIPFDSDGRTVLQSHLMPKFRFRFN